MAAEFELLFHFANRGEVFVQLLAIRLVDSSLERSGIARDRIEDGTFQAEMVLGLVQVAGRFVDEKLAKKLGRSRNRWHPGAAASPAHLTAAVDAILAAYRERGKSRGATNGFGCALVHADVAFRHAFGIHGQHPGEKRMHREVSAFDPVIQTRVEGEILAMFRQRFQQPGHFVVRSRRFREKLRLIEAQQIANADETCRTACLCSVRADGKSGTEHAGQQRVQSRESQGDAGGFQEESAPGESGRRKVHDGL